ncbi:MAG: TetR/AcrR family transcriptional regulator [Pseudomonadales bacterium]
MESLADDDKRYARSEATRGKILDAVTRCYRTLGVDGTTMEDVAQEASVGRATLYRHFSNQQHLLVELVTREMESIRAQVQNSLHVGGRCEDYLVESALIILRETPRRDLAELLFTGTTGARISRMSLSDSSITGFATDWLEPFFAAAKAEGVLRDWVTRPKLQEWMSRVIISLVTTPSQTMKSEKALREFFRDAIVPSIIQRE